jgi:hypothetical protein
MDPLNREIIDVEHDLMLSTQRVERYNEKLKQVKIILLKEHQRIVFFKNKLSDLYLKQSSSANNVDNHDEGEIDWEAHFKFMDELER